MNRRDTITALFALGATASPLATIAQQPQAVRRIGYLSPVPFSSPLRKRVQQLTINAKTARAIGYKIPASLLVRADRVIE